MEILIVLLIPDVPSANEYRHEDFDEPGGTAILDWTDSHHGAFFGLKKLALANGPARVA